MKTFIKITLFKKMENSVKIIHRIAFRKTLLINNIRQLSTIHSVYMPIIRKK